MYENVYLAQFHKGAAFVPSSEILLTTFTSHNLTHSIRHIQHIYVMVVTYTSRSIAIITTQQGDFY